MLLPLMIWLCSDPVWVPARRGVAVVMVLCVFDVVV
jgi:hypothetical protein